MYLLICCFVSLDPYDLSFSFSFSHPRALQPAYCKLTCSVVQGA